GGSSVEVLKRNVDRDEVERRRVKTRAHPLGELVVVLVRGVAQCFEKFLVAAGAAAIFGRASVLSVEAYRVFQTARRPHRRFDDDLVIPAVTEVVLVGEALVVADRAQDGYFLLVD